MNTSDYPEIKKELKKIPCDKFFVNYMNYPLPHELARRFFLDREEYTHLIIQAHDVKATVKNYNQLIEEIKRNDFDILAAVCNVERPGNPKFYSMNICAKLPTLDKTKRYYQWIPFGAVHGLIKVEFQGNAFTIISRRIIQRTDLDGQFIFKGSIHRDNLRFSASPDLTMCHVCKKLGISIIADTENKTKHYANHKPNKIGKYDAYAEFIPYNSLII